jgi:hypothetical protein
MTVDIDSFLAVFNRLIEVVQNVVSYTDWQDSQGILNYETENGTSDQTFVCL